MKKYIFIVELFYFVYIIIKNVHLNTYPYWKFRRHKLRGNLRCSLHSLYIVHDKVYVGISNRDKFTIYKYLHLWTFPLRYLTLYTLFFISLELCKNNSREDVRSLNFLCTLACFRFHLFLPMAGINMYASLGWLQHFDHLLTDSVGKWRGGGCSSRF